MLKYLVSAMVVFRRLAASHIFERSNLAGHTTPERQPRFASPKKPSTRLRNRSGLRRSWRRFRPYVRLSVSPDRNRNAIPTGFRHAGCRCGSRTYREHVIIVDVPAFLAGIGRSAAGEFGHCQFNDKPRDMAFRHEILHMRRQEAASDRYSRGENTCS